MRSEAQEARERLRKPSRAGERGAACPRGGEDDGPEPRAQGACTGNAAMADFLPDLNDEIWLFMFVCILIVSNMLAHLHSSVRKPLRVVQNRIFFLRKRPLPRRRPRTARPCQPARATCAGSSSGATRMASQTRPGQTYAADIGGNAGSKRRRPQAASRAPDPASCGCFLAAGRAR